MAIAYVQKQTGFGAGVNSFSLAFGTNVTANNFMAGCYSIYDGGTPTNATPTGGGTWSTTTAPTAQGGANAFICHCAAATGGATTVTVDYGTGFYIAGSVSEFSGLATSSVIDVQTSNSNSGSSTPTSGTTATTTQNNELIIGCCQVSAAETNIEIDVPATTGYTNIHVEQNSNDRMGHASDYKIVSTTGTQSAAWGTLKSSYAWSAKIATFKAASGSSPVNVSGTTDALTLAEKQASIKADTTFTANVDALSLAENIADVNINVSVSASVDSLTLAEQQASIKADTNISAGVDGLTLSENAASVAAGISFTATTDSLILAESAASVNAETSVSASFDTLTLSEYGAVVAVGGDVAVSAGVDALTLAEYAASIAAPSVVVTTTLAGGSESRNKKKRRRFKIEYNGQTFYVEGEDRAEAILRAIQEIGQQEAVVPEARKIKIRPVRRTRIEVAEDEIGKRLRKIEEDNEEDLLLAIFSSMRIR